MITLKLTHGLSHSNGIVSATARNPFVTVDNEADAQFCIDSGFFERVEGDAPVAVQKEAPAEKKDAAQETPANVKQSTENATASDDEDELEGMTVAELKAYAETVGIDLGKLTKKPDIMSAIRQAEAE